jgi:hypothetical protein
LKLERLQKVLRTVGNFPSLAPIRDLHLAFIISQVCDRIPQLGRQQTEVMRMGMLATLGMANNNTGNKRLKICGGLADDGYLIPHPLTKSMGDTDKYQVVRQRRVPFFR